ncbi:MAG: site-specific integrase, partial [Defluviitaleaceae bacterium]|nr:site-specific integrase [Defluviitaleaceae bacterium]
SIFQRSDGLWCGTVTTGYNADGKPVRKTVYSKTRQDVAQKVATLTADVFKHGYTRASTVTDKSFEVLCWEWFNLFVAPRLASVTVDNRRRLMKKHIFPVFGKMDVKDIDLKRLQSFFNTKTKELAIDTVHKMKQLMNNFFAYAVEEDVITKNPMSKISIKKNAGSTNKGKAMRPEIRANVLNWVMANPILKPIVITFTLTGLRPQELIAMKWVNVCLDTKVLSVKEAMNRVVRFDTEGNVASRGAALGTTKTPKSVRTFVMPDTLTDALREWKRYCDANGIQSDFVFPNTETGEMRTYSGLRSLLERFKKSHKLQDEGITWYTFRHTFATVLLQDKQNPRLVADLMGHVKTSTTMDIYGSVFEDAHVEAAHVLDNIFTGLLKENPSDPRPV